MTFRFDCVCPITILSSLGTINGLAGGLNLHFVIHSYDHMCECDDRLLSSHVKHATMEVCSNLTKHIVNVAKGTFMSLLVTIDG